MFRLCLTSVFFCSLYLSTSANASMTYSWQRDVKIVSALAKEAEKSVGCEEKSFKSISENYLAAYDEQGQICGIYDLSFPTLRSLITKEPVTELRVLKPKLKDYKIFLNDDATLSDAERFLEEEISTEDSWYSRLNFKSNRNLRMNEDGVYEAFSFSDLETFSKTMEFNSLEKKALEELLYSVDSVDQRAANAFIENPRSVLENMNFQYDSVKKAYEVFLDLDFLPVNGPVKFSDHKLQYRAWMQIQIRSIILSAFNRFLKPVSATLTGRIASVVISEGFNFVEMTYEFQRLKLEKTLRLALDNKFETEVSDEDLEKSLYLLFVQDSSVLINIVMGLVQTGQADLDNLYSIGKSSALRTVQVRNSMSDRFFSKMHYEKNCTVVAVGYHFAKCESGSSLYSLISETSLFFWSFGNPKVLNLNSPWEVFAKRTATYLLAGAVDINFLNFPRWISSQVSQTLKAYSLSGVLDEALVVSDLMVNDQRTDDEEKSLRHLMGKNIIPFIPKSMDGLESVRLKNKKILGVK